MEELFLPVLSHFQNGNIWTGSGGRLRYQLVPAEDSITAEVWEGPLCRALGAVEERRDFPLDETGLGDLRVWLADWTETVNARPQRTQAECLAARARAVSAQAEGA